MRPDLDASDYVADGSQVHTGRIKPDRGGRCLSKGMRILRGLRSELLPCGCMAGVYETYDGHVVRVVDERSPACADSTHSGGTPVPDLRSEVRLGSDRQ